MSKYGLDKFYTKDSIVNWVLDNVNLTDYDLIIEPSVGDGSFYKKLPADKRLGIDIQPDISDKNIIQSDFLHYDLTHIKGKKVLFIGNPPFGRNGSLALKFIKHITPTGSDILFILPKGFKKRSMYDKIDLSYQKTIEMDLPDNSFVYDGNDYNVPCVLQMYVKTDVIREKEEKLTPKNFSFVKKEEANLSIRRVGVNAGSVYDTTDVSPSSHYFIFVDNKDVVIENLNKDLFPYDETTGPRSISKNELIRVIDSFY